MKAPGQVEWTSLRLNRDWALRLLAQGRYIVLTRSNEPVAVLCPLLWGDRHNPNKINWTQMATKTVDTMAWLEKFDLLVTLNRRPMGVICGAPAEWRWK